MSDIELACHTAAWGKLGLIHALADFERAGFRGIEMTPEVVEQYEDRVGVFTEILSQHRLELIAITAGGSPWPGMNLDEEVERGVNIARFLKNCGASTLVLYPPRPNPERPLEEELDLMPAATAYGEIARRTLEFGVKTCLHPEVGTYVDQTRSLAKFIQMADPEALKICLDSAFLAEARIPAKEFVKEYKKKIGLIHLRDLKAKDLKRKAHPKGKTHAHPHGVELGKGEVDLEAFVDAVLAVDYGGWATVEFDASNRISLAEMALACHKYAEQSLDLVL